MSLSDDDRLVLQLAGTHYRNQAIRETHARETLGLDAIQFYVAVNRLLDNPIAEAELPTLVRRLRRLRDARAAARTARRPEPVRH